MLGLRHLLQQGLAHGDVSLENVVLSSRSDSSSSSTNGPARSAAAYTCRLIDFGPARLAPTVGQEQPAHPPTTTTTAAAGAAAAAATAAAAAGGLPLVEPGRLMGGKPGYVAPEVCLSACGLPPSLPPSLDLATVLFLHTSLPPSLPS